MKTKPFSGRASDMRDSPWLASEDLIGAGEVTVTIEECREHENVEFEGGRKKKLVHSLKFEGKNRQLILNGTNRKTMVAMYGNNVHDWIGKQITLFVKPGIKVGRETKNGIRIKEPQQ